MQQVITAIVAVFAVACSSAAPGPTGPSATQMPIPTQAQTVLPATLPPAQTAPPATVPLPTPTGAGQPTPAAATAAPAGSTAFHLVVTDGPRAGTYDVSSSGPADCSYVANLQRWNASYLGPAPLNFISVSLDEDLPTLLFTFDRDSPNSVSFRSIGEVTYEVDDRGDNATLSVVSDENEGDFADGSPSVTTGPVELTVECGAPFRYE